MSDADRPAPQWGTPERDAYDAGRRHVRAMAEEEWPSDKGGNDVTGVDLIANSSPKTDEEHVLTATYMEITAPPSRRHAAVCSCGRLFTGSDGREVFDEMVAHVADVEERGCPRCVPCSGNGEAEDSQVETSICADCGQRLVWSHGDVRFPDVWRGQVDRSAYCRDNELHPLNAPLVAGTEWAPDV